MLSRVVQFKAVDGVLADLIGFREMAHTRVVWMVLVADEEIGSAEPETVDDLEFVSGGEVHDQGWRSVIDDLTYLLKSSLYPAP